MAVGEVVDATELAIKAAKHLTAMDKGALAALRVLARKIDSEDELRELALSAAAESGARPPAVDNVSVPTYLKFCESLGLTPAGRTKLGEKKPEGKGGTLSVLRGQAQSARKATG